MNNISTLFSIKDLENLSGIKAHTIRIWEKRYSILNPSRTETNLRYYDIKMLKKLLNVTLLYNHGHKISHIAQLTEQELQQKVAEFATWQGDQDYFLNAFKLAMLNFDSQSFEQYYSQVLQENSFRTVFIKVFIPLLYNIGLEWQSSNIIPAHEHFISCLIKQKLYVQINEAQRTLPNANRKVFVLFLPLNEIHEIGLLYVYFEMLQMGHQAVYLGPSVPIDNLKSVLHLYKQVVFLSYFTVKPTADEVWDYLDDFNGLLLKPTNCQLWLMGKNARDLELGSKYKQVKIFKDMEALIGEL